MTNFIPQQVRVGCCSANRGKLHYLYAICQYFLGTGIYTFWEEMPISYQANLFHSSLSSLLDNKFIPHAGRYNHSLVNNYYRFPKDDLEFLKKHDQGATILIDTKFTTITKLREYIDLVNFWSSSRHEDEDE